MVWNVTKEGVRTRMAVVNPESHPQPPLKEKKVEAGGDLMLPESSQKLVGHDTHH